ncbi:amino acid ABC transporter substrate-binding protein [Thioclava sp. SK-1]|nr:amino acid ABC transporter substrate-binding protein [Thioclava sp. SK-1]
MQPAFAACEGVAPEQKLQNTFAQDIGRGLDKIIEDGWIEVALYDDFAPWSSIQDGQAVGVDVDIAHLIGDTLGVDTRIRLVAAGENLDADLRNYIWKGAVVNGRVSDVMLHVPYDVSYACRFDQVVFTGLYAQEHLAIAYDLTHYPDADEKPTPAYFRFDTVGVENDSISDFYLTSFGKGAASGGVRRFRTTTLAVDAMTAHEVMAVMGPRAELEAAMKQGQSLHQPPMPGLAKSNWTLGAALSFQHRPLSYAVEDALFQAVQDGRIKAIFAQHGLSYDAPQ